MFYLFSFFLMTLAKTLLSHAATLFQGYILFLCIFGRMKPIRYLNLHFCFICGMILQLINLHIFGVYFGGIMFGRKPFFLGKMSDFLLQQGELEPG